MTEEDGDPEECGDACDDASAPNIPETKEQVPKISDSIHFTVYKYKISICKPLIPLKLSLFLYYGAGSFMVAFLTLLYKERGVTLPQLATMSMASPFFQLLGSTVSGIAADKLGRSRPVLILNLVILMTAIAGILVLPGMRSEEANLTCGPGNMSITLEDHLGTLRLESCHGHCPEKDGCSDCPGSTDNLLVLRVNGTFFDKVNGSYQYRDVLVEAGASGKWCTGGRTKTCGLKCTMYYKNWLPGAYAVLFVIVLTTFTNCYRCLDVTCMLLADAHGSTFGHERVFAMLGSVLISPLAGYLADASSPIDGHRNYMAPFYLYLCMNLLLVPVLFLLPVHSSSPGRKMWKKSVRLLKNLDVLTFLAVILVLGTAWNFRKLFLFWYLSALGARSLLLGLVTSVNALYGLPFLFTSHRLIVKVGSRGIFVAALLAHAVNATGYAFLREPWFALALEVTDTVGYYVLWVAVIEYSHSIAPAGLAATVITTSGAVHFTVGKVTAGLMGKFIMHTFEGSSAFLFCALMTLTAAMLYTLYMCIRKQRLRNAGI